VKFLDFTNKCRCRQHEEEEKHKRTEQEKEDESRRRLLQMDADLKQRPNPTILLPPPTTITTTSESKLPIDINMTIILPPISHSSVASLPPIHNGPAIQPASLYSANPPTILSRYLSMRCLYRVGGMTLYSVQYSLLPEPPDSFTSTTTSSSRKTENVNKRTVIQQPHIKCRSLDDALPVTPLDLAAGRTLNIQLKSALDNYDRLPPIELLVLIVNGLYQDVEWQRRIAEKMIEIINSPQPSVIALIKVSRSKPNSHDCPNGLLRIRPFGYLNICYSMHPYHLRYILVLYFLLLNSIVYMR
jgi:hypothetical protein